MAKSGYGPAAGVGGSHASTGSRVMLGPRGPYPVVSTRTVLGPKGPNKGPVSYPVGIGAPNVPPPSPPPVSYGVGNPMTGPVGRKR